MNTFKLHIILAFLCFSVPSFTYAASCTDTLSSINDDINYYGATIDNYHLDWMNVSWLKRNLMYPREKTLTPNVIEYSWHCDDENYLTVEANPAGRVFYITGQFSSEKGAGMISLNLPQPPMPVARPKPVVKPMPVVPHVSSFPEMSRFTGRENTSPEETVILLRKHHPPKKLRERRELQEQRARRELQEQQLRRELQQQRARRELQKQRERRERRIKPPVPAHNIVVPQTSQFKPKNVSTVPQKSRERRIKPLVPANNIVVPQTSQFKPKNVSTAPQIPNNVITAQTTAVPKKPVVVPVSTTPSTLKNTNVSLVKPPPVTQPMMPVHVITSTPAKSQANQMIATAMQNSMKDFKVWFNKNLTTDDALLDFALLKTRIFYAGLRQCVPGTYVYPLFNLDLAKMANPSLYVRATSNIVGKQNGNCVVKTTEEINGVPKNTSCEYSSDSLSFFTDAEAKLALENKQNTSPSNTRWNDISRQCHVATAKKNPVAELAAVFAKNLKTCTPGKYKILKPNNLAAPMTNATGPTYLTQESVISGYQDKKCIVENTTSFDGSTLKTKCAYSQASMDFIADTQLKKLIDNANQEANGNSSATANAIIQPNNADVQANVRLLEECSPEH